MATPTITIRLPENTRAALARQADEAGVPLRTHIVTTLTNASGLSLDYHGTSGSSVTVDPTTTPQTTGMTVPSPAPKSTEPAAPIQAVEADPNSISPTVTGTPGGLDPTDARNTRHLSPQATPDRVRIREGYTTAESECEHPKPWAVFSYMTKCKACGKRIR